MMDLPGNMPHRLRSIVRKMGLEISKINIYSNWLSLFLCFLWLNLWVGCAALLEKRAPYEKVLPVEKWSLQSYSEFLQNNMRLINEKYSTDYIRYNFVVDIDTGSTLIQNLVEPELVSPIVNRLPIKDLENKEKALLIYYYIIGLELKKLSRLKKATVKDCLCC